MDDARGDSKGGVPGLALADDGSDKENVLIAGYDEESDGLPLLLCSDDKEVADDTGGTTSRAPSATLLLSCALREAVTDDATTLQKRPKVDWKWLMVSRELQPSAFI
jgi:hypothetical protein